MKAKQLPCDLEAEMSVLGAIYLDPECYHQISHGLKKEDFYLEKHRELYEAMSVCIMNGQLDLVTLKDKLEQRGTLDMVGGIKYVVELADAVPVITAVKQYARIVVDCGRRRRMIAGYQAAADKLMDRGVSVSEISDYVQGEVLVERGQNKRVKNFSDSAGLFLEELEHRQKLGDKLPGISTGFENLDTLLGGLEPGKLYIIGGRPGMGKSAFALNLATNLARDCNTVMYFSLEMRNYEMMKRIISSETKIRSRRLKNACIRDEEYKQIGKTVGKFYPDAMIIDDSGYQTMQSITSTCLSTNVQLHRQKNGIKCVIIDHLHLLSSGSSRNFDRRLQIGEMSRNAKLLADKLECPVVLLSQLSRASGMRKSNRPMLSDLRESGDIEQDADVVMFVHREEYYQQTEQNKGKAELIIAKNRDGECGILEYGWNSDITKFVDWEEYKWANDEKRKKPQRKKAPAEPEEEPFEQAKMEVRGV